jgi:tetratricopeptide (TPR) repeat protein
MAKGKVDRAGKDLEAEVWTAIAAFEQILEAMPTDRASLDALSNAYEQIGDHTRAKDYLLRFASILLEEGDVRTASELVEKLSRYEDQDPRIKEIVSQIKGVQSAEATAKESPAMDTSATRPTKIKTRGSVNSSFSMQEEMSFAWTLSEAQQITQEEYAGIVQDLTDLSANAANSTVSVLHVLENRAFKNLERIISFAARQCSAPIISVASFDIKPEPVAVLPLDFMLRRGALVFELLGKDALVVIMNPYDKQLRKDVEALACRRCHFFMTLASEFDRALGKARDVLSAEPSGKG